MSRNFLCKRSDVPENGMRECEAQDGLKVLVVSTADGEYFACQATCPHQDVALCEGLYDGAVLTCHQHLWQWDIRTGAPIGLAEAPLECYKVEVDDDSIYMASGGGALDVGELFAGIAGPTLERIKALARCEEFPAGGTLYRVGDPADDFFVLESGRIEFVIGRDDRISPAGFMLRKGEVFGWAALLDSQPQRIAKATCMEPSTLLRINGKQALKVLEADPVAGYVVMRRLSSLIARYLAPSGAK
jgi:toluene monooxygenase system ferredoxin subunit